MKSTNKEEIKVKAFSWYGINVEASNNPNYKLKSSSSIYWPFWLNQPMFVFTTQIKNVIYFEIAEEKQKSK